MAYAGARLPTMAKCCVCVDTSPESATSVHVQDTRKEDAGHLASVAHLHRGPGWRILARGGYDNIVAALEHPGRVRHIELWNVPKSDLDRCATAMTEPFPELTFLGLSTIERNTGLVLPDLFLGGSAPRLRNLYFNGISFPAIPKLLSSASDLVDLRLWAFPILDLTIWFQSPRSRPGQPSPPRSIRTALPALNYFGFRGVSEYLEDLTSHIDASLLSNLEISLFNQLIFDTPQLSSFISRAEKLRPQSQAWLTFYSDSVEISRTTAGGPGLKLIILCEASDWQLSSLAQVCGYPFLSDVECLEICEASYSRPHWQEDVENIQWLELLHLFTTVKRLSLSKEFTPRVIPALQELSGEE
ncbi:hypothetical protein BC826DRAFT_1106267 [Russula brevipes]|nr:hypothetical protein BC826DRAFT_1106267 [Russula brevipes]